MKTSPLSRLYWLASRSKWPRLASGHGTAPAACWARPGQLAGVSKVPETHGRSSAARLSTQAAARKPCTQPLAPTDMEPSEEKLALTRAPPSPEAMCKVMAQAVPHTSSTAPPTTNCRSLECHKVTHVPRDKFETKWITPACRNILSTAGVLELAILMKL